MTVATRVLQPAGSAPWRVLWSLGALTVVLGVRLSLQGGSTEAALTAGFVFGAGLLGASLVSGWRPSARLRTFLPALGIGAVGGCVLIVLPRLLHPDAPSLVGMRPQPFVVWVAVTLMVAAGEEVLLRGVLLDATNQVAGPVAAVALSSIAFALLHVPLYGWSVVPLDLAVGVWFCGLRLATRSLAAPTVAHAIADLASWWL